MTDLRLPTARIVEALQVIVRALVEARPDAAALRARIEARGTRVIVDEGAGLIVVSTFDADGRPDWIESVRCDPSDPGTFGKTAGQVAAAPARAN